MSKNLDSQPSGSQLTAKQRRAIILLALGVPAADVAEEVSVAKGTIYNWKSQHADFRDELEATQRQVFEEGVRQLHSLVAEAAASLRSVLVNPSSADRDKIFAARTLLQFTNMDRLVEAPVKSRAGGPDEFLKRMGLE